MRKAQLRQSSTRIHPLTVAVCGLVIFRPGLAGYDFQLQIVFGAAGIAVLLCLLLSIFKNREPISWYVFASLLFCGAKLPQTLILNSDGLLAWGTEAIALVSLSLLFSGFGRGNMRSLISGLYYLFLVYVVVNLITVLRFSTGEVRETTVFFLGIRVDFTVTLLAYSALSLLYRYQINGKAWIHPLLALVLSVVTIYLADLSTAWVSILAMFGLYLWVAGPKKLPNLMPIAAITGIAINVLFVVFRIQEYFDSFINKVLGRNTTLTGRTEIWDGAIEQIAERPFFGYGQSPGGGAFVLLGGELWPAHNSLLQILHEGGLFLLLIYLIVLGRTVRRVTYIPHTEKPLRVLAVSILAFLIAGIAGGSANSIQFFMVLYLIDGKKKELA